MASGPTHPAPKTQTGRTRQSPAVLLQWPVPDSNPTATTGPFDELEQSILLALGRYSNVHRGTGLHSLITTELYEAARSIILDHLGLADGDYIVVFCTERRLRRLEASLRPGTRLRTVTSADLGLPLGVHAAAVPRRAVPAGVPYETGGGTIKMVSPETIAWADLPDRLEAGTPNIIGVIALARALLIARQRGPDTFINARGPALTPDQVFADGLNGLVGAELLYRLRELLVGRELTVPTDKGEQPYTNLDNGASTPTFIPVWQTFCRAWRLPESAWPEVIAAVRDRCHRFFGAPAADYAVFFTCNTTEAVNVATAAIAAAAPAGATVVLNTMVEHNSNELPWRHLEGVQLERVPVDDEGFIDIDALEARLRHYNANSNPDSPRVRLVAVCGASNVMGTFNDLAAIGAVCRHYHALLFVDAAQLAAHRPVRMAETGIDLLAFSAHKMHAPFGSGGLIIRRELVNEQLAAACPSGEENVAGIAALGKAIDLLERIGMDLVNAEETRLTAYALAKLRQNPALRLYGVQDPECGRFGCKGGILSFAIRHIPHNRAARLLAERGGIGVRNGCFCVNMYVKKLLGIGRTKDTIAHLGLAVWPRLMERLLIGLVRVSFSIENTEADVDRLVAVLEELGRERSSLADRLLARINFGTPFGRPTPTSRQMDAVVDETIRQVYGDAIRPRRRRRAGFTSN